MTRLSLGLPNLFEITGQRIPTTWSTYQYRQAWYQWLEVKIDPALPRHNQLQNKSRKRPRRLYHMICLSPLLVSHIYILEISQMKDQWYLYILEQKS